MSLSVSLFLHAFVCVCLHLSVSVSHLPVCLSLLLYFPPSLSTKPPSAFCNYLIQLPWIFFCFQIPKNFGWCKLHLLIWTVLNSKLRKLSFTNFSFCFELKGFCWGLNPGLYICYACTLLVRYIFSLYGLYKKSTSNKVIICEYK